MNTSEGLMRIALVVRWIGYLIAAGLALVALTQFSSNADSVLMLGIAASFAAAGWALAWIIEGFAKSKS